MEMSNLMVVSVELQLIYEYKCASNNKQPEFYQYHQSNYNSKS